MKIRFKDDSSIDVVTNFNEATDEATTEEENFAAGTEVEVDLLNERDDSIDIQFGCGDCCYGLLKEAIEILERDEDE